MERPEPEFFADDNAEFVNFEIINLASEYSASLEVVERYKKHNSPEGKEASARELTESLLGPSLAENIKISGMTITPMGGGETRTGEDIVAEEYAKHYLNADEKSKDLVDLVGFLQENARQRMTELELFDTEEEITEMSWRGVWGRLATTVKPVGGVVLADVADIFDELVCQKYSATFDTMDHLRGAEARADVSARTFYEVFQPHLKRATMRSGEDGWAGH